ncbi:alpha/beta hydrolase [Staphylococcus hominis]|uniref:Alpha/beta hydrolase n=1 Tax=Staphylococcus epidermidis TaxID=1282 RepID=A0A8I0WA16_STAEP|nr:MULTISPECIES: alpha/beta hydrolase [Staphylococcus]HDE4253133.1 alpha/beta hydrolase [Staphylococcus aureus]ATQ60825.1 carboxylesterase [Staphylococcus epidermidis]MBE7304103.1 alpha/beta hydrolase [Staphylococcus epidermidis]MBE7349981.1 alpha/beta hydrolase [Staphylococcus epidermidis]MBE7361080.1 alpha/beta hydrolase [Staphylococcus epidermidis]
MEHIFRKGNEDAPTLILLHGTGGDETDLIPLGAALNSNYNLLSIRGEVNENGMNRYFRRLSEGVYDEKDLNYRSQRLLDFIKEVAKEYQFDLEQAVLVGFSNGSNIAINMLLRQEAIFKKAILFAPLYPIKVTSNKDMSDMHILLSMGKQDPIVPVEQSEKVIELFKLRHANVTEVWVNSHEITQEGILKAQSFLS